MTKSESKYLFDVREKPSLDVVHVPLVRATEQSLKKFGCLVNNPDLFDVEIVTWPASGWRPIDEHTGNEGGSVQGIFECTWQGDILMGRNDAVNGHYVLGWSCDPQEASKDQQTAERNQILLWHMNYHGGFGTVHELENDNMLTFLREKSAKTQITCSVCTGSALLAKAGVLDGLKATSNKQFFALARLQSDKVEWIEAARWVDAGSVVTSSGVSAGMDMTLAMIARLLGKVVAEELANAAEYTWHDDPGEDPFVEYLDDASRLLGLA